MGYYQFQSIFTGEEFQLCARAEAIAWPAALDSLAPLMEARMRLDPNGNVEVLQAFWNLPADEKYAAVVPPLLAYADLMATQDGRNLETARLIYEQFLEPIHRR